MRKISLFFLLFASLFPDQIDEKVRNLVDPQSYVAHQKLIEIIFRNKSEFYNNQERLDSIKIVNALKENGLLDIFYKKNPQNLSATFKTTQNSLFFLKAVGDSLSELGYNYTIITHMNKVDQFFEWTISYKSDHAIDPALLSKRLDRYGIVIDDIEKRGTKWFYSLFASEPKLAEVVPIYTNEDDSTLLLSPQGEFWIGLESDSNSLKIRRKTGATWFPYVVFYNEDLKILSVFKSEDSKRLAQLKIPQNARYAKVQDSFTSENLRHGILVWTTR